MVRQDGVPDFEELHSMPTTGRCSSKTVSRGGIAEGSMRGSDKLSKKDNRQEAKLALRATS
jgi:hypothetical protein